MSVPHGPIGDVFITVAAIGTAAAHWLNTQGRVISMMALDDTGVDWKEHPQRWAAAHRRTLPAMLTGVLLGVIAMIVAMMNGYDTTLELVALMILVATLLGTMFTTRRFLKQDALELVKAGETTMEEIKDNQDQAQKSYQQQNLWKLGICLVILIGLGIYALINGHL